MILGFAFVLMLAVASPALVTAVATPVVSVQSSDQTRGYHFDCVIYRAFYQGSYDFWVQDGWWDWYGPYLFHSDAVYTARELLWKGLCDRIIDRSWGYL